MLDDYPNLQPLGYYGGITDLDSALRFVFGNGSGPSGRPVSMASFLLDDAQWPAPPFAFKHTNLMLHLICGLALLLVLQRIFSDIGKESYHNGVYCSLLVFGLWLLHPINVSTVLYVIQRMAILAAIFSLFSVYFYLIFRANYLLGNKRIYWIAIIASLSFAVIGVFSKENAILVFPFLILLEVLRDDIYGKKIKSFVADNWIKLGFLVTVMLVASFDWWGRGYLHRDFSLFERMIYQLPVLGDYALKILLPSPSDFNLFSGSYESASVEIFALHNLFRLLVTLFLVVGLLLSIKYQHKMIALGLGWFFMFHALESTLLPLELYFEHRNYIPSIGLIIAAVFLFRSIFSKLSFSGFLAKSIYVSFFLYLTVCLAILTFTWAKPGTLYLKWEMDEPESVRAQIMYAQHVENLGFEENAFEHIVRAQDLSSGSAGIVLRKMYLSCRYSSLNDRFETVLREIRGVEKFNFGVFSPLKRIIDDDKAGNLSCTDDGNDELIVELFENIESTGVSSWNARRGAQYFYLKSDYYSSKRNFPQTILALEKSVSFTPTVDLYLRLAVAFASAGLYEEALRNSALAREADDNRAFLKPSRSDEIASFEKRVQSMLSMGQSS
ncbi:hypothetical protein [Marinobacter salarius]|uniref:hypothetical protein n=1 Tax=Marinobacter salarius TaxID=1420917 RepID=UPI003D9C2836